MRMSIDEARYYNAPVRIHNLRVANIFFDLIARTDFLDLQGNTLLGLAHVQSPTHDQPIQRDELVLATRSKERPGVPFGHLALRQRGPHRLG